MGHSHYQLPLLLLGLLWQVTGRLPCSHPQDHSPWSCVCHRQASSQTLTGICLHFPSLASVSWSQANGSFGDSLALLCSAGGGVRLQDKRHSSPGPGASGRNSAPWVAMSFRGCALPIIQMGKLEKGLAQCSRHSLHFLRSLRPFRFSTFPWEVYLGS